MIAWDPTNWTADVRAAANRTGDLSARATGLVAGTRVATAEGWRDVSTLIPGDRVLTFDAGFQTIRSVGRHALKVGNACDTACWPLAVPAGAIGNLQAVVVMPGQAIVVESDMAEEMLGDPFVAVRGSDLDGLNGIARIVPDAETEVVTLHFDADQVVFVAGGALALCEGTGCLVSRPEKSPYRILEQDDAELILLYGVTPAGAELARSVPVAA